MFRRLAIRIFVALRKRKYRFLSDNRNVAGKPIIDQPVLTSGKGKIIFGKNVCLGFFPSPFFYNGYIHLEARQEGSKIIIGDDVFINNNFFAISDLASIEIGAQTLIGTNCEIIDSDFHDLDPEKRLTGTPASGKILIGRNVFLGNNVKITKGVMLGDNVVVANGSVVTGSFPANQIIGGVPAKIIGTL